MNVRDGAVIELQAAGLNLLQELEWYNGVVIFATNLAANFDPAFERRVRTHVLFEMPGVDEREQIWRVQMHPQKTPLGPDVDFRALAEQYEVSGGDIKNAVLKAAQMATMEPGPDGEKRIQQRHFEEGMREVLASKKVMEQSLFAEGDGSHQMVGPVAHTAPRSWIVDAGRCTPKGNSGSATDPFGRCRSGAARQLRGAVGVVESVI